MATFEEVHHTIMATFEEVHHIIMATFEDIYAIYCEEERMWPIKRLVYAVLSSRTKGGVLGRMPVDLVRMLAGML